MNDWPVERLVFIFLGAAYLLVWVQVTLFHWKGAFRSKAMWGPVIFTPLAAVAGLARAFVYEDWVATAFVVIFAVAVLEGLIGFILHFRGVATQIGGVTMRNLAMGPPVILPLTYAALGGLGLLVHYWPRLVG